MNVQNVDGKRPLQVAIERQQSDVVEFLLKAGADVGLTHVWRNTPLHYLTAGQLQCGEHEHVVTQTRTQSTYVNPQCSGCDRTVICGCSWNSKLCKPRTRHF